MKTIIVLFIALTFSAVAQQKASIQRIADSLSGTAISGPAVHHARGFGVYKRIVEPLGAGWAYPLIGFNVTFSNPTDSISVWGGALRYTSTGAKTDDTLWYIQRLRRPVQTAINTGAGSNTTRDTVMIWFSPLSNSNGSYDGQLRLDEPGLFPFYKIAAGLRDSGKTYILRTVLQR